MVKQEKLKSPTIYIQGFPPDLHKEAKLQAVREGTSLKGLIIKAVTEYLDRARG